MNVRKILKNYRSLISCSVNLLIIYGSINAQTVDTDILIIGAKDYANFPSLEFVPRQIEAFEEIAESQFTQNRTVVMSDQDDGTPEFPLQKNLEVQLQRVLNSNNANHLGLLYFAGYGMLVESSVHLAGADFSSESNAEATSLNKWITASQFSPSSEIYLLELVTSGDSTVSDLQTSIQTNFSASPEAGIVTIWNQSPGIRETQAMMDLYEKSFQYSDLIDAGNQNGSIEASEFIEYIEENVDEVFKSTGANKPTIIFNKPENDFAITDSMLTEKLTGYFKWENLSAAGSLDAINDQVIKGNELASQITSLIQDGRGEQAAVLARQIESILENVQSQVQSQSSLSEVVMGFESLTEIATEIDLESSDPASIASANALMEAGKTFEENNQLNVAIQTYEQGMSKLSAALLARLKSDIQESTSVLDDADWLAYAPVVWGEKIQLDANATAYENNGELLEAINVYKQILDKIEQAEDSAIENLIQLAKSKMTPSEYPVAEVYLKNAKKLDPANSEVERLLSTGAVRYKYNIGDTVSNEAGMTFTYIPPGSFTMGSPVTESNRNEDEIQHTVEISSGFFLGTTEVTWAQWRSVMGTRQPRSMDSSVSQTITGDTMPVCFVTWQDAVDFCESLSNKEAGVTYRLPTEAEWEFACRTGTVAAYHNSRETITGNEAAVYTDEIIYDNAQEVASVGLPNQWGLYDMHGNLWEWCSDWKAPYNTSNTVDPTGPTSPPDGESSMKVARGGSWFDDPPLARSANRGGFLPVVGTEMIGFRVLREAKVKN